MKIKAIITGSTGMVGEGILHECLKHPDVESVLVINRRPCGIKHEKLTEIIHKDFADLSGIEQQLKDYNACYFCAGVTSVGKSEDEYTRITYDLTLGFAKTLSELNPEMTFTYVSGAGTDSSEKGKIMWARVKGKTENDLLKLPFKSSYMFRPGLIKPIKGLNNTYRVYKFMAPLFPFVELFFKKYMVTLEDLGKAMINVTLHEAEKEKLECKDITSAAKTNNNAELD